MALADSSFLPAPLWLITALHILTLSLHLTVMSCLVGSLVIVLWGKLAGRWQDPTVRKLVRLLPTGMAATATLGVAPLLFLQLVYPRQVYAAAIVSGWLWMGIIAAVIIGYYFLYGAAMSAQSGAGRRSIYLTLSLCALVYVSLVYSSTFALAERPLEIKALYAQYHAGALLNPHLGDYFLRWLHMILGALTLGGFSVALLGRDNPPAFRLGRAFFLWGMVLNAIAGLSYLLSLADYLPAFAHSAGLYSLTLGLALAALSAYLFLRDRFLPSGLALFVSLVTMVVNRHILRLVKLGGHYDPSSLRVAPQWSVFVLFVVCLVVALASIGYMLHLFAKDSVRRPG
jgi:hypothetical protein